MPKQKKPSKTKLRASTPARRQAPGGKYDAGKPVKKPFLVGISAGIALILFALIWNFAGRNDRTPPQSDETEETSPAAGTEFDFTESQYGIEMKHVLGGTIMMGCTPEQKSDCYEHEDSAHMATLNDFYIGKYEVTQAQWRAVTGSAPSHFQGDDLPVESVSWDDVQEFIEKLNAATGKSYRLPTKAEWEYAARGGGQNRGYKYSGSNDVGEVAWYEGNSESSTHPVGTKKANELGIHDMSGNVWEWTSDLYGDDGNQRVDTESHDNGPFYIIRGGGWGSYARGARVSNQYNNGSGNRYNILGFRLACDF